MATTLANLLSLVKLELRDPQGFRFKDPAITYCINQAYRKTFIRVASVNQDYFVLPVTFNLTSGVREYVLPTDHLKTKRVEFASGNIWIPMLKRERGITANSVGGVYFNVMSNIPQYDFEGNNLVIEPTPLSTLTNAIRHTYYQTPVTLVTTGNTIHSNFKDLWVDVLVLEAAWACLGAAESVGAVVSTDILKRLTEMREALDKSLGLRTLSPVHRRKKGYFS